MHVGWNKSYYKGKVYISYLLRQSYYKARQNVRKQKGGIKIRQLKPLNDVQNYFFCLTENIKTKV